MSVMNICMYIIIKCFLFLTHIYVKDVKYFQFRSCEMRLQLAKPYFDMILTGWEIHPDQWLYMVVVLADLHIIDSSWHDAEKQSVKCSLKAC